MSEIDPAAVLIEARRLLAEFDSARPEPELYARPDIPGMVARSECDRLTAEVSMLRGSGCLEDGDGPCGVCIKCLRLRAEEAEAARDASVASSRDKVHRAFQVRLENDTCGCPYCTAARAGPCCTRENSVDRVNFC